MKKILIVDDEKSFLQSLSEGLKVFSRHFLVETAENGKKAQAILKTTPVNLVVTDLKMPVMDGFELLAYLSKKHPEIPVVVMTAFGNPEIEERVKAAGIVKYIEKPLDFEDLAEGIREALEEGSGGSLRGITLPGFMQLVEMEQKTCTLLVKAGSRAGKLFFSKGELLDAETEEATGEKAALEIVGWEGAAIEIDPVCRRRKKTIGGPLHFILLEGMRLKDENNREPKERGEGDGPLNTEEVEPRERIVTEPETDHRKEERYMNPQEKMKELAGIEGFGGAGVYTPTGEALVLVAGEKHNIKEVGVLANDVLRNAQKASLEMGTGRGHRVHVEAEKAHILVRCLNEGNDPLKSEPGKAHIHMVLVLLSDSSLGLAKMRMEKVALSLAEDFRG